MGRFTIACCTNIIIYIFKYFFFLICYCNYSPFSIQPISGFLKVKDKMDFKIIFKTMNLGESRGALYVTFETGNIYHWLFIDVLNKYNLSIFF